MADKKATQVELSAVDKAKNFWDKSGKTFVVALSVIVALVAAWAVYTYMFKLPKQDKANDVVYITQKYFQEFSNATDSSKALIAAKVLNGDGTNPGALKIINSYSGTPAANLCQYYAGACYLYLGQFDKSLGFLKDFKANGATQIESRAYGMMGDASAELNKVDQALDYYKKAANVNTKDDFTSAEFLFRAALYAQFAGKTKDAVELFKKVRSDYPLTQQAGEVDRYLAKLGDFSE